MRLLQLVTHGLLLALATATGGCIVRDASYQSSDLKHFLAAARDPGPPPSAPAVDADWMTTAAPRTLRDEAPPESMYWNLSVEEAIQLAVTNSTVLRDLGGTVIRTPQGTPTILDPSIQETDPRQGVHAALAAFDAEYSASVVAEKNDRALNNLFTAGGTRIFQQDLLTFQHQISKRAAAGTELAIRQNIDYDSNNAFANLFPSVWNTNIEAEFRQPLLQGAGANFNRIAGPENVPGVYNGIVIARTNNDISLTEFEIGLRNLVSNVENAYWDLYFAYRDLDARIAARDAALQIWRRVSAVQGRDASREAQAREQYYRLQEEVQNALSGRPGDGTSTNNGTTGGTFRGAGGVLYCERRLRLLLGVPLRDDQLIRPSDEPTLAPVTFEWNDISAEGVIRRAEVRRQRLQVRRRELELIAARNFLLPQFDVIGRYRWRGFGDDLIDIDRDPQQFDNAFQDLTTGDFQEWQLGGEFRLPIGFRRGHAAVRNAQLQLARERALLEEQERQILYDLSNAYAELQRAGDVVRTAYNRRMAAKLNVEVLRERMQIEPEFNLDQLLDAERRFADADVRFHRAAVEYVLAVKNVHFEKGTLLDYGQVYLTEEDHSRAVIHEQAYKNRLREKGGELISYVMSRSPQSAANPPPAETPGVSVAEEPPVAEEPQPVTRTSAQEPFAEAAVPPLSEDPLRRATAPEIATPTAPPTPAAPIPSRAATPQAATGRLARIATQAPMFEPAYTPGPRSEYMLERTAPPQTAMPERTVSVAPPPAPEYAPPPVAPVMVAPMNGPNPPSSGGDASFAPSGRLGSVGRGGLFMEPAYQPYRPAETAPQETVGEAPVPAPRTTLPAARPQRIAPVTEELPREEARLPVVVEEAPQEPVGRLGRLTTGGPFMEPAYHPGPTSSSGGRLFKSIFGDRPAAGE